MLSRLVSILLLTACVLAHALTAFAAPQTISYQGRLTNAAGVPVSDGTHTVVIKLWDDAISTAPGDLIWTSGSLNVTTKDGVFTALLDVISDFLVSNPEVWVGVQVPPDVEMTPRRRLVSAPYAVDAIHADFAEATSDIFLNSTGDVLSGALTVSDGVHSGMKISPVEPQLQLFDVSGFAGWYVLSGVWTEEDMFSRNLAPGISLSTWPYSGGEHGGEIILNNELGDAKVVLNGAITGDGAVQFQPDAINSDETLNEPGIASNGGSIFTALPNTRTVMKSVVITIPAAGYIMLQGRCGIIIDGGTQAVNSYVFISDDPAEGVFFPDLIEMLTAPGTSIPVYSSRIFFREQGMYTFHLVGYSEAALPASGSYQDPMLTATYFPTAYGAVTRVVSSQEASQFSNREAMPSRQTGVQSEPGFTVDLRELELRAAQTRAAAEQAEKELLKAKMAERREQLKKK